MSGTADDDTPHGRRHAIEEKYSHVPEGSRIYSDLDHIESVRETYTHKKLRASRRGLRLLVAGLLTALIAPTLSSLSFVPITVTARMAVYFFTTTCLIQAGFAIAARYYAWRADLPEGRRTHYLEYPDGTKEEVPEPDAYYLGAQPPAGVCRNCALKGNDRTDDCNADADAESDR